MFLKWITFGSVHEVRAFRERKIRSLWFRGLVENCVVYGDRGYRGCDGEIVEEGEVLNIFDNPQHPYTQELLSAI